MRGTLTMSAKELDRLEVLGRVIERRLTQRQGGRAARAEPASGRATVPGASERRSRRARLAQARAAQQPEAARRRFASTPWGSSEPATRTSARRSPCEKLREQHGFEVSVETLRHWMIEAGLWVPRARSGRRASTSPGTGGRVCGELIQIDGCDHAWFEDRGPKCTLLVFVDDATSRLMELRFVDSESTFDYFAATRAYLERHGKPVAFYSDKASVFRVTTSEDARRRRRITQFGRALSELNIDILCANTPQAKGRVERAHLTLQDRLVKELRLRGISTPEAGNAFAAGVHRADYNQRFGRELPEPARRPPSRPRRRGPRPASSPGRRTASSRRT